MRLLAVTLDGIRSYMEPTRVELAGVRCASVVGANGAGKSTLVNAIPFALYGPGQGVDDLLTHDGLEGEISVEFEVDDVVWKVTRGRRRGQKSWLSLARDSHGAWQPVPTHTIAETQSEVDRVLGMSEDVFRASVFSAQGQAGLLASLSAGERKRLLGELLGLDVYEDYRHEAARRISVQQTTLSLAAADGVRLALDAHDLEGGLIVDADARVARARVDVDALELEREQAIERERAREQFALRERYSIEMGELLGQSRALADRRERMERLRGKAGGYEAAAAAARDLEREVSTAQEARAVANAQASSLRAVAQSAYDELKRVMADVERGRRVERAFDPRISELARRTRELDDAELVAACQLCGQTLTDEGKVKTRTALEQQIRDAAAEHAQAETDLATTLAREESVRKRQVQAASAARVAVPDVPLELLQRADDARAHHIDVAAAEQSFRALAAELESQPSSGELRQRWEALRVKRDALPREPPEGPLAAEVRDQLAGARIDLSDAEAALRSDQERRERLTVVRAALAEANGRRDDAEQAIRVLEVIERAFSRNGIPAQLLDGAVVGIEAAANDALTDLGVAMHVRLETQRVKRDRKGVIETLDIIIDDGLAERALESFSGGEQYRVHMALRIGLARALGQRTMGCVLIDEVTDLDAAGVRQLADMLTRLDRQVLLVTHAEDLVAAMPQQIVVSRESSASPSTVEIR